MIKRSNASESTFWCHQTDSSCIFVKTAGSELQEKTKQFPFFFPIGIRVSSIDLQCRLPAKPLPSVLAFHRSAADSCKEDIRKNCDDDFLYPEPGNIVACLR